jgi:hypothetical protein
MAFLHRVVAKIYASFQALRPLTRGGDGPIGISPNGNPALSAANPVIQNEALRPSRCDTEAEASNFFVVGDAVSPSRDDEGACHTVCKLDGHAGSSPKNIDLP